MIVLPSRIHVVCCVHHFHMVSLCKNKNIRWLGAGWLYPKYPCACLTRAGDSVCFYSMLVMEKCACIHYMQRMYIHLYSRNKYTWLELTAIGPFFLLFMWSEWIDGHNRIQSNGTRSPQKTISLLWSQVLFLLILNRGVRVCVYGVGDHPFVCSVGMFHHLWLMYTHNDGDNLATIWAGKCIWKTLLSMYVLNEVLREYLTRYDLKTDTANFLLG